MGALITRPTLKPNLLQKPPFRFLHDIVSSLIGAAANWPAEYFSSEESDSATLDSSEKKMSWLKRLIEVVEAATGEDLSGVQVKKIVAGLEADKTNLLLQALARAAASGVTAKEAMERRAGGAKAKEAESKAASRVTPVKVTAAATAAPVEAVTSPQVPKLALKSVDEPPPPIVAPVVPGVDQEAVGRLERPMTARQGPPKPKPTAAVEEKAEVREEKEADTKADSKPAAANNKAAAAAAEKRKGLIVEGEQVEEDEIAEEAAVDTQQAEQSIKQFEEEKLDASEQGGLMRKILQSTNDANAADPSNGAVSLATLTPASSADDRSSALRAQLQRLCQSITPLGRVMECVVDDMDDMAREMSRWRKQREEYEASVEEERRQSVRVVEPLQVQLEECERRLVEWERKVMVQKSVLWRNEHNLHKLMQQKVAGES